MTFTGRYSRAWGCFFFALLSLSARTLHAGPALSGWHPLVQGVTVLQEDPVCVFGRAATGWQYLRSAPCPIEGGQLYRSRQCCAWIS